MNIKANLKHAREKAEMLDLKNKKIMVVGAGISGIGAVHLLNQVGADVVLYDGGSKLSEDDVIMETKHRLFLANSAESIWKE